MADIASAANADFGSAYAQSFGTMPDETRYVDHFNLKCDLRGNLQKFASVGMKALNTQTGGAGTAGYAMVPIYLDPQIVDLTRKETPLVELMPRVTNRGTTADYNQITAKGGGRTAPEDADQTETTTTTDRQSVAIKYLYAVGRVTGQAIASYPSYVMMGMVPSGGAVSPFQNTAAANAKQFEILVKTREMRELEENLIVAGNATTSAITGNPNGTEFNGFLQLVGTTNTVDKNTAAMALSDVDLAIQYAFDDGGRPNLGVCASNVFTDLLGLLTAKIGYMQATQQVFWGFSTIVLNTMVGQIPIIPSRYMSNTSGSKSIYFLDMSVFELRVLQDLTFEDLAKTNDSEKFMLKIYEALICRAPQFNCSITEIA